MKDKILDMPLGDRMKFYESQYEIEVEPEKNLIIRIDGHKFSTFTKGFKKPFDYLLSKAMELTTMDLVKEFNAVTGYTQSDEISLVIPSYKDNTVDNRKSTKHKLHKCVKEDWKHEYSGRIQKMSSLIAGFTTMAFNEHMKRLTYDSFFNGGIEDEEDRKYIENISNEKVGKAWFDCRVYGVDSKEEAFNSVMWRSRDNQKNSKSGFAQAYCSHKQLQNLNGHEQIEYCLEKTGADWNDIEDRYKYGIFVKKENYEKITLIPEHSIKGVKVPEREEKITRTRLTSFSIPLTKYSEENINLIMRKIL